MPTYKFKVVSTSLVEIETDIHLLYCLAKLIPTAANPHKPFIYMFRFGYDYSASSTQKDYFGGNKWVLHQILASSNYFSDSIDLEMRKPIEYFDVGETDDAYHMYNYFPTVVDGTEIIKIDVKNDKALENHFEFMWSQRTS